MPAVTASSGTSSMLAKLLPRSHNMGTEMPIFKGRYVKGPGRARSTGVITDTIQMPAQLGGWDPRPTPSGRRPDPPRLLCRLAAGGGDARTRGRLASPGRATPANERGDSDVPAALVQDLCLCPPLGHLLGLQTPGGNIEAGRRQPPRRQPAVARLFQSTHRLRRRAPAAPYCSSATVALPRPRPQLRTCSKPAPALIGSRGLKPANRKQGKTGQKEIDALQVSLSGAF